MNVIKLAKPITIMISTPLKMLYPALKLSALAESSGIISPYGVVKKPKKNSSTA